MMKKIYTSMVILTAILLLTFVYGMKGIPFKSQNSNDAKTIVISEQIQHRLIQQSKLQFNNLVDYDLEALDEYAPKDEEMEAYYKIFDENAFQEKYNFFAKNYTTQGMNYGEDAFYDRDLIMRIGSRASVLRSRSNLLNSEQINLGSADIEIDKVFVTPNLSGEDFYDLHIRFYHPKSEGYYEFVNEACWLTDRTCINTLGWRFLGRYNPYTKKHAFTQMNIKDLH